MSNPEDNSQAPEVKEQQPPPIEPQEEYNGPWIEKRIEYKTQDRSRRGVVVYGSWNGFRKGEDLEYQGKQIYAVTIKLPLGSFVYRFLIDNEEWETNNETAKTIKDGIEYNTITVKDKEESEEEEEENAEDKQQNTQVIFDESSQKFVVGKKKRRGRPSMEVDLGKDFNDEVPEPDNEPTDNSQNNANNTDNNNTVDSSSGKPEKKKKKKKGAAATKAQNTDSAQEKEWARMVFVQQLRQQQQHNDEINRVKTLWKQERQVRVEMHKKVVKEKKKLQKDLLDLQTEVERLQALQNIGAHSDKKLTQQLEQEKQKTDKELENIREELKKTQDQLTSIRKERVEEEKTSREKKNEWENQKKKFQSDISSLTSQITALKTQNSSLESSLEVIKQANKHTVDYQSEQFTTMQQRWESEKEEFLKSAEELKKLKTDIIELKKELTQAQDAKVAVEKKLESEKQRSENLEKNAASLKDSLDNIKNSTEASDKIRVEVEKARKELESEKNVLNDKINILQQKLVETKENYEQQLTAIKQQNQVELETLTSKSDKEVSSRLDALKQEIGKRDDELVKQKDKNAQLETILNEEKSNNENITKKYQDLNKQFDELRKGKDLLEKDKNELSQKLDKTQNDSRNNELSLKNINDELNNKISTLERELAALNAKYDNEKKETTDMSTRLETRMEELRQELSKKMLESNDMNRTITENQQTISNLKVVETTLNERVISLQQQLENEQREISSKTKEFEDKMNDLATQLNNVNEEKSNKIRQLEDDVLQTKNSLSSKLKEFNEIETKFQQLQHNIESEQKKFEREKQEYEKQLSTSQEKEEKIHASCKALFSKFQGVRDEMKSVKDLKIAQLEEMQKSFQELSPVLNKVFKFNETMIDNLMQKYKRELTLRRKYFNTLQELRGNIRVFCRVRPLLKFELDQGDTDCLKFPFENSIVVTDEKNSEHSFEFDRVYSPSTRQEDVSEDTTEYIQSVMDGYNVSIFAYGQTGSGKTFTMDGTDDNPGVNLRALRQLFKMAEDRAPMFEYNIKVSIFEIYNEEIRDLIASADKSNKGKDAPELKVRHLPDGSVDVLGLAWIPVTSDADVIRLSNVAKKHRSAGVTDMNAHSSRSHMLLVVEVKGFNKPANIEYLGKLYLVDLAGSERVKKSGAQGQALKEAQNINSSLAALGDVMQALQEKKKFIPYRNSTLTDLMTNSLGGNAKTVMFINCCPTARHAFETVSSLKFASRVAKVELGQAKATVAKK